MADPIDLATTASPIPEDDWTGPSFPAGHDLNGFRVLELAGEYDFSTDEELQSMLADCNPGPHRVLVLDMSHVTFIDASTAGRLLDASATTQIILVGATGLVRASLTYSTQPGICPAAAPFPVWALCGLIEPHRKHPDLSR
jgi:STAS domain